MERSEPAADFQLGDWHVQASLGRISSAAGTRHLRPLLADLLLLLAQNPGRLVSKDEIARTVWGRRFLSESALTRIVAELRRTLGDDVRSPRYIETIPKRGYRLIAAVTLDPNGQTGSDTKVRIAVLPFENLSGDAGQEYFSDGMTEELIGALAEFAPLRLGVIARTSSMHYKGSRKNIGEIGRELKVDYLLEGSVRRGEDRVRVSAQLIQASDQMHRWSATYDSELHDLLGLQSRVAHAIARAIDIATAGPVPRRRKHLDPDVHDACLRGMHAFSKLNPESLKKAAGHFEWAAARDPNYCYAHARLAVAHAYSGYFGYSAPQIAFPKAEAAALRALAIDESIPDAHQALGFVHWFHQWNLAGCEREFERAVALGPNDPSGHFALAMFLGSMKQDHARAALEAVAATELNPLGIGLRASLGWLLYWSRQHDRAIEHARQTLELDPNCPLAYYLLGHAAVVTGRYAQAIAAFQESTMRFGDPFSLAYLGMAYGFASERAAAQAVLARLENLALSRHVPRICLVWANLGLGNPDITIDALERVYEAHDSQVLWLPVSSVYDCLRPHPRFEQLLRRLPVAQDQCPPPAPTLPRNSE